jgi:3-hydroxybutyryl-CoA dehydrogenase
MSAADAPGAVAPTTVGVVGQGVIGAGVAQRLLEHGLHVVAVDSDEGALARARTRIANGLRTAALTGRELRVPAREALERLTLTADLTALAGADAVVENVTERVEVKAPVLAALDGICAPDAVVAVNTSCIPIAELAAPTERPERVLGIHFMNPPPLIDVAEVVPGPATSEAALARATALLERIGVRPVVVGDSPGFVSNRVLMLAVNEAIALVEEDVARAPDVDAVFTGCLGHRTGPLATADLIGLDTVLYSLRVLESHMGARYAPRPLLVEMVGEGRLGRKSGAGFFTYGAAA